MSRSTSDDRWIYSFASIQLFICFSSHLIRNCLYSASIDFHFECLLVWHFKLCWSCWSFPILIPSCSVPPSIPLYTTNFLVATFGYVVVAVAILPLFAYFLRTIFPYSKGKLLILIFSLTAISFARAHAVVCVCGIDEEYSCLNGFVKNGYEKFENSKHTISSDINLVRRLLHCYTYIFPSCQNYYMVAHAWVSKCYVYLLSFFLLFHFKEGKRDKVSISLFC